MEGWANDIASLRKRQEALEKKLLQAQLIRRLPGSCPSQSFCLGLSILIFQRLP